MGVTIDVYDSNEAMQPIISAGNSGYDLIVPSDYMVAILIEGEDIQPLNKDAIPERGPTSRRTSSNLIYDPDGAYSLPVPVGHHWYSGRHGCGRYRLPPVVVDHLRPELRRCSTPVGSRC